MNDSEEKLIKDLAVVGVIGAVAYFGVVKPILNSLGIDPATQEAIDKINETAPPGNPFSIHFAYSLYTLSPSAYGTDFWNNLKDLWNNGESSGGVLDYAQNGELIHDAFGYLTVNRVGVNAVFQAVPTQAAVSNIACYLFFVYGEDLFSLLRDGKRLIGFLGGSGLPGADITAIIDRVDNLPVQ